ncbi:hypothetical protein BTN50_2013 [Candidatus Enterovibrio altilux]|uniref:Mobile element protein n=1 Tax=Candidatus Enterovibrio altilux TaxID=1927128 RepID=A0A291BBN2_9GAMM|nr:hypothetical protein BTN50_2013 [Candidatus Enterovibrio luxaltus]
MTDGAVLLNLLKEARLKINEMSADGAYDIVHIKRAVPFIPLRKGAIF